MSAQRWFVVGLVLLFVGVGVQYSVKVLTPRNGETTRSAIVRWREQLQGLDAGENIYQRYTYPNPPIMAMMLRPLAELPPLTGALVWFAIKVGLALASYAFAFRLAEDEGIAFPPWAKALCVALTIRPVIGDLTHGNVNLLILFLVAGGLYWYRRGWDVAAGIAISLAIACKVTPALFVPYFLWKRSWRTLAGIALGLVLFFFAIPGVALGWSHNWSLLSSWFEQMVLPFVAGGVVTSEHQNQSLPGLVFRLLTRSPSFSDFEGDKYIITGYHNLVDIGPIAAKWLVKAAMAGFALMVVMRCRTADRRTTRHGAEVAMIVVGMLLFSERTWKHHAVTLVLPAAVLCYQLALQPERRRGTIAFLVFTTLAMTLTSTGLWPDDWAKLAQVYGGYTLAFAAYVVGMARMLRPAARNEVVDLPLRAAA